jgi:hypothetical protein
LFDLSLQEIIINPAGTTKVMLKLFLLFISGVDPIFISLVDLHILYLNEDIKCSVKNKSEVIQSLFYIDRTYRGESMNPIMKQLRAVEGVSERLDALSTCRGVPDNVSQRLQEESKSLRWAFDELRKLHYEEVTAVIGDTEYLHSIVGDRHLTGFVPSKDARPIGTLISFRDPELREKLRVALVPPKWEGNRLAEGQVPDFIFCERYFATSDDRNPLFRAVWFDCMLSKQWLSKVCKGSLDTVMDTTEASRFLHEWMASVYTALNWDKAKRVG